ncbi:MAG: HAD family hydrolase [Candidatus Methylumidiphilus sp.]
MKKLIVFDWDGTLSDSETRIVENMIVASDSLNLPSPSRELIADTIGMKIIDAISVLYPEINKKGALELKNKFREISDSQENHEPPLFSKVLETLKVLSKYYQLAIATNKSINGIEKSLSAHSNLTKYLTCYFGTGPIQPKPSQEMMQIILQIAGAKNLDTIMIGDTEIDFHFSQRSGVDFIGLARNETKMKKLINCGVKLIISDISELPRLLKHYEQSR